MKLKIGPFRWLPYGSFIFIIHEIYTISSDYNIICIEIKKEVCVYFVLSINYCE